MRGRLRLLLTVALKDSPPSELGGESFRRPDRGKTPCAAVSSQSLSRFSIPVDIPIGAGYGTLLQSRPSDRPGLETNRTREVRAGRAS